MTESEIAAFQDKVRRMRIHAQGIAVRDVSGKLAKLSDEEKERLGVDLAMARDVSSLVGQEFQIPGTSLRIKLLGDSK